MKVNQIISEKHYSGPLYHATDWTHLESIIKSGEFKLRMPYGKDANLQHDLMKGKNQTDRYKYFFSASREKLNAYRLNLKLQITIVIDGGYYSRLPNTIVMPVDHVSYWSDETRHSTMGHEENPWRNRVESEERIWSKNNRLPLDGIIEIHALTNDYVTYYPEAYNNLKGFQGEILDEVKGKFPLYLYHNEKTDSSLTKDYLHLNKKKAKKI